MLTHKNVTERNAYSGRFKDIRRRADRGVDAIFARAALFAAQTERAKTD